DRSHRNPAGLHCHVPVAAAFRSHCLRLYGAVWHHHRVAHRLGLATLPVNHPRMNNPHAFASSAASGWLRGLSVLLVLALVTYLVLEKPVALGDLVQQIQALPW